MKFEFEFLVKFEWQASFFVNFSCGDRNKFCQIRPRDQLSVVFCQIRQGLSKLTKTTGFYVTYFPSVTQGRSPTTLHGDVQSEMAWLWTRTRHLGTLQKPRPHWTTDLILGQKSNAIFDPEGTLIQLCPDWQRTNTWKCMMHFPTQIFSSPLRV